MTALFSMALMTGLFSSGHCLGMCGGLVAAFSLGTGGQKTGMGFHLGYNLGRILTYVMLGLGAGWIGSALAVTGHFSHLGRILLILTDVLVIVLGLGTAGLWRRFNLARLEFTAPIQALLKLILPLQDYPTVAMAFPLGLIMGFLPCGLLYAMLLTSAQSSSPMSGAMVMFGFGLGTAPSLFLFGTTAHWLSHNLRMRLLRLAGLIVALTGSFHLWKHLGPLVG